MENNWSNAREKHPVCRACPDHSSCYNGANEAKPLCHNTALLASDELPPHCFRLIGHQDRDGESTNSQERPVNLAIFPCKDGGFRLVEFGKNVISPEIGCIGKCVECKNVLLSGSNK